MLPMDLVLGFACERGVVEFSLALDIPPDAVLEDNFGIRVVPKDPCSLSEPS